jgi:hypothetical protein
LNTDLTRVIALPSRTGPPPLGHRSPQFLEVIGSEVVHHPILAEGGNDQVGGLAVVLEHAEAQLA